MLLSFVLLSFQFLIAQSVNPTVIGSAGGEHHDPELGSLAWTVGELDPVVAINQLPPQVILELGFHHHYSDPVTAITKQIDDLELQLYPNPTHRFLNIESDRSLQHRCSLYSISGQRLRTFVFTNRYRLNLQEFPPGAYLLKVIQGDKLQTFQIIKTGTK
ncbi:MAG: T9SS type A sorting domain-containing protein [Saprospiraceae bacterium]|nr:T9SS type A sorting domain-containing protein [Saprospiraceae bacterium]